MHDFLPVHLAGAELYTYYLGKALKDQGHDVHIYTREYGYFDQQFREEDTQYDGLKIKTVYFNTLKKNKFKFLRNFRFKFYLPFLDEQFSESADDLLRKFHLDFYNPVLEKHFDKYIQEIKPDIIHIQHLKGLSASFISIAKKRKIPTVLTLHDYWFMCNTIQLFTSSGKRCSGPRYGLKCPNCLLPPTVNPVLIRGLYPFLAILFVFRTLYLRHLLNKVDLIISPSNFLKDKFIKHGISEKKIIFSDNGVKPPTAKSNKATFNGKLRFSFIGSAMPHKGVHVLIEAFNKLMDDSAELKVYGDPGYAPKYYQRLKQMATNSGIKFMGRFENNRVYKVLAETDVLVIPSVWYENSPITIHEAALAGVPVLASNIGGMAELVKRMQNGLLFHVENVDDLLIKLKRLIYEPELRKKLNGKAQEVKSIAENALELQSIYLEMVEQRKN